MAPIQACLAGKFGGQQRAYVLGSALLLLLGLAASALTLAVYEYPLRLYFESATARFVIAAVIFALTVVLIRPRDPQETIPTPSGRRVAVPRTRGGFYHNPLTPGPFTLLLRVIPAVLLFGPRMIGESFACLSKAHRLGKINLAACAAALTVLYRSDEKVPLKEVYRAVPDDADPGDVVAQLLLLRRGVLLIHAEPTSLILTTEFRDELRDHVAQARESKRQLAQRATTPGDSP